MFGSHSYIGSKSRIDKGFVHPVEFLTADLIEVFDFGRRALYATFLCGIATKVVVCHVVGGIVYFGKAGRAFFVCGTSFIRIFLTVFFASALYDFQIACFFLFEPVIAVDLVVAVFAASFSADIAYYQRSERAGVAARRVLPAYFVKTAIVAENSTELNITFVVAAFRIDVRKRSRSDVWTELVGQRVQMCCSLASSSVVRAEDDVVVVSPRPRKCS
jgi:hypothetical protein